MTIVEALIELQEVDGRIRECEKELKDLPQRRAKEVASLKGVSHDLEAALAGRAEAESRVTGFDDDAAAISQKIDEMKRQQLDLSSNKEYQDFSVQIDLLNHKLEAAKSNSNAAMDFLSPAEMRIREAQAKFDARKEGVDAFCAEIDERIAAVNKELEAAKIERAEKKKLVNDMKFVLYYERLATKRWPVVVPLTHDGVCDGCHLVQPPSIGQLADANAKNGEAGKPQSIVACTMCGRILYRA